MKESKEKHNEGSEVIKRVTYTPESYLRNHGRERDFRSFLEVAKRTEDNFEELCRTRKIPCVKQANRRAPFDFLVNGLKIDVKGSSPYYLNGHPRWQFNIHPDVDGTEHCDFYVFRLEKPPFGTRFAIHLMFGAPLGVKGKLITARALMEGLYGEQSSRFREFFGVRRSSCIADAPDPSTVQVGADLLE